MPEKVGIAGTGRVAQALARLLVDQGEAVVCVAGRDARRTRLAAEFAGPGVEPVPFSELPARATRWLIAVSDTALQEVACRRAGTEPRSGIALHTCGTKDEDELLPLRRLGFCCGTLHPLQTISEPLQGVAALRGAAFAVSGDKAARG